MPESLKKTAYDAICEKIVSGEIVPGDRLNRRTVARELGMSVAPVLEAMVLLTREGLLETKPRSGTRVRIPTHAEVLGRFLVREALECQTGRLVHGEPVRKEFGTLLPLAKAVDAIEQNTPARWKAEIAFHTALADITGSPVFSETFRRIVRANLFFELKTTDRVSRKKKFLSHVELLKKLRDAKSADEAEAVVRHDLRDGKESLFAQKD